MLLLFLAKFCTYCIIMQQHQNGLNVRKQFTKLMWHNNDRKLSHMQVCISPLTNNHASTHHSVFYRLDASCCPTNKVKALKGTFCHYYAKHWCGIIMIESCLQCFGWQEGHLACKKLSGEVLAWLSVWGKVQICIWSSWYQCHSLSLAPLIPYWFYLSGTRSSG